MRCDRESHAREEVRDTREQAHTCDAMLFRLSEKSLHQTFAASAALLRWVHSDGTNLRQMRPIEMKRATADDPVTIFKNHEIADVLADLRQRARQQSAVAGICRDQGMDLLGIRKARLTRTHGPSISGSSRHARNTSVPHSNLEK